MQRRGAGGDRDGVADAEVLGELALERLDLLAGAQPAAAQHRLDRREVLRLHPEVEERDRGGAAHTWYVPGR